VRQLPVGPMKNWAYLVGAPDGRECFVIDPAWDVPAILKAAEESARTVVAAVVTHHHHDHVNGLEPLLEACDVPIYAQQRELEFAPDVFSGFGKAVRGVKPSETLELAGARVTCLHTPGHTPGSHCLSCGDVVFTGDTLFVNACGRCDFEGSDVHQLHQSLFDVLGALNSRTLVFPGHHYGDVEVSSIGREKERNPYYQHRTFEAFARHRLPSRYA